MCHTLRVKVVCTVFVIAGGLLGWPWGTQGGKTSFDLSRHSVPLDHIQAGGPEKDGIPALLAPRFVKVADADFLADDDRVLGLGEGVDAKAYPIKILNWHEIVNDRLSGEPILITYCPLCGTGMAFRRTVRGSELTFGVSGLLYQSDLLMYDHHTESLWSQIGMKAVAGPETGTRLSLLYVVHTTWGHWKKSHPMGSVLSPDTGHIRDYNRDPYGDYARSRDLMFEVTHIDPRFHPKEWVLGVHIGGKAKAYPFSELEKTGGTFVDRLNGRSIRVYFDHPTRSARVTNRDGRRLPAVMAFWFAWYAFYPDTEVFRFSK